MQTFMVVGVYEEDYQRVAESYECATPDDAEAAVLLEFPGLIIAAVFNAAGDLVA